MEHIERWTININKWNRPKANETRGKKEIEETKFSKLWKRDIKQYQGTDYTRNKYKRKKMEWFNKKIERMSIMDKVNMQKRIKELRCAHQQLA